MRAHWFGASGSIVALLLGLSSANAQDGRGGAAVGGGARVGTTETTVTRTTQGEIGVQARPALTPEDQLREANAISKRATQLAERLTKMLDEARREKDIMRANCINRKLTEVNANTRNVEQRMRSLRDAAASGDDSRRSHEYTVLTVLAQKLEQLDDEATQCLGQSLYEAGASQVVTTIQGGGTAIDPTTIDPATAAPPTVVVPPPLEMPPPTSPVD